MKNRLNRYLTGKLKVSAVQISIDEITPMNVTFQPSEKLEKHISYVYPMNINLEKSTIKITQKVFFASSEAIFGKICGTQFFIPYQITFRCGRTTLILHRTNISGQSENIKTLIFHIEITQSNEK